MEIIVLMFHVLCDKVSQEDNAMSFVLMLTSRK